MTTTATKEKSKAKEEKFKVWNKIEQIVGRMEQVNTRRADWKQTLNKDLSIFVTFSKFHESKSWYWFDIHQDDLDRMLEYDYAFIIFVLGNSSDILIIPARVMRTYVKNYGISISKGNVKLNIYSDINHRTINLPQLNLNKYFQLNIVKNI